MKKILLTAFAVSALFVCCKNKVQNKYADEGLLKVHQWADQHQSDSLIKIVIGSDLKLAREAALMMASIQDNQCIIALSDVLKNSEDGELRANAIYALGNTPSAAAATVLQNVSIKTPEEELEYLIALAKHVSSNYQDTDKLLFKNFFEKKMMSYNAPDEPQRESYAKALLIAHNNGVHIPDLIDRIPYFLQYSRGEARIASAYALIKSPVALDEKTTSYVANWLKTERNPDVRAILVNIAGKTSDPELIKTAIDYAHGSTQDINVRVAAVRALKKSSSFSAVQILDLLEDKNEVLVQEVLSALVEAPDLASSLAQIEKHIATKLPHPIFAKIRIVAGVDPNGEQAFGEMNQMTNPYQQAAYADALSAAKAQTGNLLKLLQSTPSAPVRYAAATALASQLDNGKWNSA